MATTGSGDELKVLGAWLKGLRCEYVEVDLKEKNELLLASNPVHKKILVLLHAGKPLIVQYIAEAFAAAGPSFLPADPHTCAVACFWGAYVDDKLLSSWIGIFATKDEEENAEALKQTLAAADALEGAFRECSGEKLEWFGGDGVGGYAEGLRGLRPPPPRERKETSSGDRPFRPNSEEIFFLSSPPLRRALPPLLPFPSLWERDGSRTACTSMVVDPDRTPLLAAWKDRFCALDAAKAAMPALDRLLERSKKYLPENSYKNQASR
ncbi:hypothetical protein BRADI_2g41093v3 [Brachypodium distachyon]|uniref:GST N-terminal domain-containing protein n=1 Tax=Brachypodium distachyon TaxID=15368 RepID=A0A0Q3J6T5_BRADI|nr:hypothetical protein BRADI_2g41093v3 [Brachypodium distachyon]